MDDNMEERLNLIGSKIQTVDTLIRAIETCLFGVDELEEKDAGYIFPLLREQSSKLTLDYSEIIKDLHI